MLRALTWRMWRLPLALIVISLGIVTSLGSSLPAGAADPNYVPSVSGPVVTSVAAPTGSIHGPGDVLDFVVQYSAVVAVDTSSGIPYLTVSLASGQVHAPFVYGSGTSQLHFEYTVVSGDFDESGKISLGPSIVLNSATIEDAASNPASTVLVNVASLVNVWVDGVAPTVSFGINGTSPTNATSVTLKVYFSEPVSGLDNVSLYSLVKTGTATGSISSATYISSLQEWITVTGVGGNGTLGLTVPATNSIVDGGGNTLDATYNSGALVTVDTTAPSLVSMTVPPDGTYGSGQDLVFTVTYSEPVNVVGSPLIPIGLDIGGTTLATYLSGTGTSTLAFRYVVASGNQDLTGIDMGSSINLNGGSIRDAATNNAALSLTTVAPGTSGIHVDGVAPVVISVSALNDKTYIAGDTIEFFVDLSKDVNVDTTNGTPSLPFTMDTGVTAQATLVDSGGSTLIFDYTVLYGDFDANGVTLGSAINLNNSTISDSAHNPLVTTLNGVASSAGVLIDAVPPEVSSIDTDSSSPTNKTSLSFTVTFSEPVTGVDASDFTTSTTGTLAGTISAVTPSSASTYIVTVSSVTGDGTLGLGVNADGTGIADLATNPLSGGFTGGETYSVEMTPPAVTSVTVPKFGIYIADQGLDFAVTFSEPVTVTGTPRLAITLDAGGTVYADYQSGSGTATLTFSYTVQTGQRDLTGITMGSSIGLNGGSIVDAATNAAVLSLNSIPDTSGVLVDAPITTTTVVTATGVPNPLYVGGNVVLHATVSAPGGVPVGAVTFLVNGSAISSCSALNLSAGAASCSTSFQTSGLQVVSASFTGALAFSNSSGVGPSIMVSPAATGYLLFDDAGDVKPFGSATDLGSLPALGVTPVGSIVGEAMTSDGKGYWLVSSGGGVYAFGDAPFYGSAAGLSLNGVIVGIVPTSDDGGYWLVAADGGVFTFGDAPFYGSAANLDLNGPIVSLAPSSDGLGYTLTGNDGGVFDYGDANRLGQWAGTHHFAMKIVGMASTPDGGGFWLVGADGSVFSYGDAQFYGSAAGLTLNQPIVSMVATPTGLGYWLIGADGGVFAFGDATFFGSTGGQSSSAPTVGIGSISS
jgi:Bacterial Ig-like domain (group 3)